jgi:hypothetical protein
MIMEYLIVAVIAFIVGYRASEVIHVMSFKKILEDLGINERDLHRLKSKIQQDIDPESPAAIVANKVVMDIKVEQVEGQLFAYDLHQNTFIAQGQNSDELIDRLLTRLPTNTRICCDRSNGGDLIEDSVKRMVR